MKKNLLAKFSVIALSLLAVACGSETPDGPEIGDDPSNACPLSARLMSHNVTLHANKALPGKLAIILDGQMKYDECLDEPVIGNPRPIVEARKKPMLLEMRVIHGGAYPSLPERFDLQVLDRKDCAQLSEVFYQVGAATINWVQSFPNGPSCPADYDAHVQLTQDVP